MKFKSASSASLDPYRLGIELAEQFKEIEPEVILVFASVSYANFGEIYEAMKDTFSEKCPIVMGGTGDGIYETQLVSDNAVTAMAINSEGKIKWKAVSETLEGQSGYQAASKCIDRLKSDLDTFNYVFILSDFRADGTQIVKAVNELSTAKAFGGFVSDDRSLHGAFTTLNGQRLENSLVMLGMRSEVTINVFNGSGYRPEGRTGVITSCEGPVVRSINDMSPLDFIMEQTGKSVTFIDKGVLGMQIFSESDNEANYLRSIADFNFEKNEMLLFGGVTEGSKIQVCSSAAGDMVVGVKDVLEKVKEMKIRPEACLIVSCAGRKWLLGNQISHEVSLISEMFGRPIPIAGFPSLGEISPVEINGKFKNQFHNVTYVLVVFGDKD